MDVLCRRGALVVAAFALLHGCAAAPPKHVLDDNLRSVGGGGGTDVVVVVTQRDLVAGYSAVHAGSGGGGFAGALGWLLGGIVVEAIDQHRRDAAEENVRDLRAALGTYDFDRRALAATQSTISKLPWLDVRNVSFTKEDINSSTRNLAETWSQSSASQLVVAHYGYTLLPKGRQMAVVLHIDIFAKNGISKAGGPYCMIDSLLLPVYPFVWAGELVALPFRLALDSEPSLDRDEAVFTERFQYVQRLPAPARDAHENAAEWAANGGTAARSSLDRGIAVVNDLLLRRLSQTPSAETALDQGHELGAAGQHGKLIESSPEGTLSYNDGCSQPARTRFGTWTFVDGMVPSS